MHYIPEKRCLSYFEVKRICINTYFISLFYQLPYNSSGNNARVIKHCLNFLLLQVTLVLFKLFGFLVVFFNAKILSVNVCSSDFPFLLKYWR